MRPFPGANLLLLALVSLGLIHWGPAPSLPVFLLPAQSPPTVQSGYRDFSFGTTGLPTPTGEKPESKLWWNDGFWWGSLYNDTTQKHHIYRLDPATQSWFDTGTVLDDRKSSKADVLWDTVSQKLYVVSHLYSATAVSTTSTSQWGRLYRYTYNSGSQSYTLDPAFPVTVSKSRTETLVLAKDSRDKLWVTYVENGQVMVNRSLSSDLAWGEPFVLPLDPQAVSVTTNDISSILAFGGSSIGVMWSNGLQDKFYFALHRDGDPDNVWQPVETTLAGPGISNDHVNLKADSAGRVYAALKTSLSGSASPVLLLLVRNNQQWTSYVFGTGAEDHTRPILLLDEVQSRIYLFARSAKAGGALYYKISSLDNISFSPGLGEPFIQSTSDPDTNNPTSTKQIVNSATGLLVLASDQNTKYYLHNYLSLAPPASPAVTTLTPLSGPAGATVTLTGSGFTAATQVAFGGTPAGSFTVVSDTQIQTSVPTGAASGKVSVTTAAGTGTSIADFTVFVPPAINSFSPTSGVVGTEVTFTGTGFIGSTSVVFGGTAATSFTLDSDTQIRATVPTGAATGRISVTNPAGIAISASDFAVIVTPTINLFSPASGPVDAVVTLAGKGFTGTTAVAFNGVAASSFIVDSDVQLRATVPAGTSTGKISVSNAAGTGSSSTDFTVLFPPAITSFSPSTGPVATIVTLLGSGFIGTTSVTFNATPASSFTVDSHSQLRATVPPAATAGTITVTNAAGTAFTATNFIPDNLPPSVTVISPNGGETLFFGSPHTITWVASDDLALSSSDVFISFDGRVIFSPVPGCTALPASTQNCTWIPVGPATTRGLILVTARDAAGNIASDASNNAFTILSSSAGNGIWISPAEIAALPMSGAAWNNLKAEADLPAGTPNLANQDDPINVRVMAKALVYARTGIQTYRAEVIDAVMAAIGTEQGGRTLALGRELSAYVIAADLVGLPADKDLSFRTWLRSTLTKTLDGETLQSSHESRPNNWGTHAGASRAAVARYLGDNAELARTAQVFKGWLGDRSSYAGFVYGTDLSWQCDPSNPVGINPKGCTKQGHSLDGAVPDEQRRCGIFGWPPCQVNYAWEGLQGALAQAVILSRAGYDVWNWQDQALLRAVQWLHTENNFPASADDTWQPHLVNFFYGSRFPAPVPSSAGKNVGWTDWTHGTAVAITPTVESDPSRHPGDTARDSAIWIHPTDPSLSFVIGNDTTGGLSVYGLDGRELQYVNGTNYEDLDLRYNFPLSGQFLDGTPHQTVSLLGVGNKNGLSIDFYKVNPNSRRLESVGSLQPGGLIPSGACMYRSPVTGTYYYFVNAKSGLTQQWALSSINGTVTGTKVREFDVGGQAAGCVADDVLAHFYISQEAVGIWKYGAEPGTGNSRTLLDKTGSGGHLTAPVKGLTLYYAVNGTGYLLASSRGDDTFAVYAREGANSYLGAFRIIDGNGIDGVSSSEGTDVVNFSLGPAFPGGLFVTHDSTNPGATATNLKFVRWDSIANALSLTIDTSWDPRAARPASGPPIITSFTPTSGPSGTVVTITGSAFAGATAVAFNETAAAFTVDSATSIRATAPAGVTSGKISVTNVAGTAFSATDFTSSDPPPLAFTVAADAQVKSTSPTSNYGGLDTLRVRLDPGTGATYRSYLKFIVTGMGGNVTSARLRLYVTDASNDGGSVYSTASTWTELGINWNNAPPPGVLLVSARAQPINSYIEVPLPAGIFSTGNGTYCFVVISSSTDSAFYSSREGAIPPQLLLNQGGAVPPPPVADFSATPLSGAAPLTVAFNSNSSTGNPTSWNWDFQNDGSIDSTAQNPTCNYSSAGIYSIKFTVTNATGINSLTKANYITVSPSITSFSPSSGPAGTQLTLIGTGFTGTTAVKFNGIAATTFTVDSGTQLRATVPATATSGKIGVTSGGVTGASLTDFTVIVTPAIISLSPTSGPPGTQVTLTGTSFTGATAVAFNGTAASSFTLDSDTQIRASVPAGATTGKITVVNAAGSGVSAGNFTVPPPPTVTFLAVADAYVKSTSPASNYGTLDNLRVRTESGTGTVNYRSYLKFTVSGLTGTVTSAKLRLYITDASNDGGSVYSTATTWTESVLTWNTAPLPGTLVAAAGAVPLGTYIEIVLPASLFSSGNGSYSLVLISSSTDSAIYNSRESANPPQLILTQGQ